MEKEPKPENLISEVNEPEEVLNDRKKKAKVGHQAVEEAAANIDMTKDIDTSIQEARMTTRDPLKSRLKKAAEEAASQKRLNRPEDDPAFQ